MIALWQLLILICLVMPIGGALASARLANTGITGYAVAVTVGLIVGTCCSWTMWSVHKTVAANLRQRSIGGRSVSEWYFRAFYFSKILWIAFALFLGIWLSSWSLRLVF